MNREDDINVKIFVMSEIVSLSFIDGIVTSNTMIVEVKLGWGFILSVM